jgi:hypothetical protein
MVAVEGLAPTRRVTPNDFKSFPATRLRHTAMNFILV